MCTNRTLNSLIHLFEELTKKLDCEWLVNGEVLYLPDLKFAVLALADDIKVIPNEGWGAVSSFALRAAGAIDGSAQCSS